MPSLWRGPGFHVPLSQLHEAHASLQPLLEPWFSQEFQHQPGAAPRCAGRQGKQEVSSRPCHRHQGTGLWYFTGSAQAGIGCSYPASPPDPPLLTHPLWLPIALRRQCKPCPTGITSPEPQDFSTLRSICPSDQAHFCLRAFSHAVPLPGMPFHHLFIWPWPPHFPGPSSVFPPPPLRSLPRLPLPPQAGSGTFLELLLLPVHPPPQSWPLGMITCSCFPTNLGSPQGRGPVRLVHSVSPASCIGHGTQ